MADPKGPRPAAYDPHAQEAVADEPLRVKRLLAGVTHDHVFIMFSAPGDRLVSKQIPVGKKFLVVPNTVLLVPEPNPGWLANLKDAPGDPVRGTPP